MQLSAYVVAYVWGQTVIIITRADLMIMEPEGRN